MSPDTVVGIKDAEGKEYKYYPLAGNHHVDIFENIDTGERKAVLVPRFYAAKRQVNPQISAVNGTNSSRSVPTTMSSFVEIKANYAF
ncbi:MAG: hypothetical protein M9893_02310 [Pyrinomonadaceae bacterium]|nr:hypothetical protein [Pyrinomonadaceae bacterium]